jgi:hypothetical protein
MNEGRTPKKKGQKAKAKIKQEGKPSSIVGDG